MGLLDRIKNLFRKNKLLGDGRENPNIQNTDQKENEFKDKIAKEALENLTPEQWQKKFLEEQNLGKYIRNPFSAKFLLSIPEIAEIKNKESYENARNNNVELMSTREGNNLLLLNSKNNANKTIISFSNDSVTNSYTIGVERNYQILNERNIQKRTYDMRSGIETERYISEQIGYHTTTNTYKRSNKFGLVEKYKGLPENNNREEGYYIDLTQQQDDIGTLDGTEHLTGNFYWEVSGEQEEVAYNRRLNDKINHSIDSKACREYAGISDIENERVD